MEREHFTTHRLLRWGLVALCCVCLAATSAQAGQWPHARKGRLWAGLGLGGGLGRADVSNTAVEAGTDYENGTVGSLRGAYGLDDDLTAGIAASGWIRSFKDSAGVDRTWRFGLTAAEAAWFPGGGGFYVRGGLGFAAVHAELSLAGEELAPDKTGWGSSLGLGYEWQLGKHFALGGAVDSAHLDVADGVTANYLTLAVMAAWYM